MTAIGTPTYLPPAQTYTRVGRDPRYPDGALGIIIGNEFQGDLLHVGVHIEANLDSDGDRGRVRLIVDEIDRVDSIVLEGDEYKPCRTFSLDAPHAGRLEYVRDTDHDLLDAIERMKQAREALFNGRGDVTDLTNIYDSAVAAVIHTAEEAHA